MPRDILDARSVSGLSEFKFNVGNILYIQLSHCLFSKNEHISRNKTDTHEDDQTTQSSIPLAMPILFNSRCLCPAGRCALPVMLQREGSFATMASKRIAVCRWTFRCATTRRTFSLSRRKGRQRRWRWRRYRRSTRACTKVDLGGKSLGTMYARIYRGII